MSEIEISKQLPQSKIELSIVSNTAPLNTYINLLKDLIDRKDLSFDISNISGDLVRIETDSSSAATGEILVTLYPSDGFLRFSSTVLAGKF